jgi:hypothetical protein
MTHRERRFSSAILVSSTAAFLVLAVMVGALVLREDSLPSVDELTDPDEAVDVLTDRDLSGLSDDDKGAYARRLSTLLPLAELKRDWGTLSSEERETFKTNLKELDKAVQQQRLNRYFDLSPEQRVAYLDAEIDKLLAAETEAKSTKAGAGRGGKAQTGKGPAGNRSAWIDDWVQNTPAEERARLLEYKRAIVDRMEERGIERP